jgi:uncharacterized membrane protein (DUF2068 family)
VAEDSPLPGVDLVEPSRFLPHFHYELLVCGVSGHELIGIDARELREEDRIVARVVDGVRWHRCLRCDSWLPVPPPDPATREFPPRRAQIELPLRGRPLRDKVVLRLIAINRAFHFLVLGLIAVVVFVFASHRDALRGRAYRVLVDLQTGTGGAQAAQHGLLHDVERAFSLQSGRLQLVGGVFAAYAAVEGLEAVGLWFQRRWAEYLTFLVTASLLPLEVYELSHRVTVFKLITFVINVAVVVYLLVAKRLFGLRGGAEAERREREADMGWPALERTAPEAAGAAPSRA